MRSLRSRLNQDSAAKQATSASGIRGIWASVTCVSVDDDEGGRRGCGTVLATGRRRSTATEQASYDQRARNQAAEARDIGVKDLNPTM